MTFKSSLTAAALLAVISSSAFGLTYSAASNGTTAPAGVTFKGFTGEVETALGTKSAGDGSMTLGVKGGAAGNEIDLGQRLVVSFSVPQIVTELTLGLLFNGAEYGDFKEIAVVKLLDGSLVKLTADTDLTATLTGAGSVVNAKPAVAGLGGAWSISNPFGSMAILGFTLFPEQNPQAPKNANPADFGLTSFATRSVAVPDVASTLALAGIAMMGLGLAARRRA